MAGLLSGGLHPLVAQPTAPEAAVPIGSWRTHFSYCRVLHVAVTPERVYGAATNGLFYVSRDDHSVRLLTKSDGLNDVGVVALAYEPTLDALMLAYQSGRIDVLIDRQVIPFTLIQEANQDLPEVIYGIHWRADTAFVSTSQGVRVLTVQGGERPTVSIRESYTDLSAEGNPLVVYDATTSADSLFLATEAGIIANAVSPTVNRQDFATWRRFGPAPGAPPGAVRHVAHRAGTTYAAFDSSGLYRYQSGRWQATPLTTTQPFHSLRATASGLIATFGNRVATLDDQEIVTLIDDPLISGPQAATVDEQGVVWVADQDDGLLRGEGGTFTSLLPNGPASDEVAVVRHVGPRTVALLGDSSGTFSAFAGGAWSTVQIPSVTHPLSDVALSPDTRTYYVTTLGDGLVRWDGEQQLEAVLPPEGTSGSNRFTALAEQANRLWVTRASNGPALLTYLPTESVWRTLANPLLNATYPRSLAVDYSGYLWMVVGDSSVADPAGRDILVFDEAEDQVQTVRTAVGSGNLPGDRITDLVVDQDGLVWVGGNRGIAYFPNPFGIFSEVVVAKPVFDRQPLLRDEYVACLAVDGGNRKWVGTRNGLWLFSDTGQELIHHFTTANSPLISNNVLDITINGTDGEVFIATDRGLVSYRGDATQATNGHASVKVFPNPVRSGFDGTVGIQGLAANATVKVTSISGVLVQELRAQGGTATWDVRNYAGQRVSTGVYLLFSATADGEETYVGKLAVVP